MVAIYTFINFLGKEKVIEILNSGFIPKPLSRARMKKNWDGWVGKKSKSSLASLARNNKIYKAELEFKLSWDELGGYLPESSLSYAQFCTNSFQAGPSWT